MSALLHRCPACGQPVLIRHGVRLPPRLAAVFDSIERCGENGINCEALAEILYPEKWTHAAKKLVAVNVCQLNEFLVQTDLMVTPGRQGEPYRIVKRPS